MLQVEAGGFSFLRRPSSGNPAIGWQLPPGVDRIDILPGSQDFLDQMAAVGAGMSAE
ncbi:hypothetical protein LJR235_001847 [Pararhizobium sp. LjRoot235]|uniref:hypothetical protein n=1 Tax=Pararhizobium sp. LjRoot235 TaxID=3342291 RepID=UPI003ED0EB0B